MRGGASINLPLPNGGGGSNRTDSSTLLPLSRGARKLLLVGAVAVLMLWLTMGGSGSQEKQLGREQEEQGLKGVGEMYPEQTEEEEVVDYRRPTPDEDDDDDDEQPSTSKLAKAILAKDGTSLTSYLSSHFPLSSPSSPAPHLWLTLSDGHWATSGTHALHTFVQRLNRERAAAGKGDRETRLVVLCLDETCVRNCEERGMYAFGGFMWNRPEKVSSC